MVIRPVEWFLLRRRMNNNDYLLNNGTSFGVAVKTYAEHLLDTAKKGRNKNEL